MTTKHTLGPWKLRKGVGIQHDYIIRDTKGETVLAWTCYGKITKKESRANARLIAAAPDLLGALQYLVQCSAPMTGQQEQCWISIRAAIKKATGETA